MRFMYNHVEESELKEKLYFSDKIQRKRCLKNVQL